MLVFTDLFFCLPHADGNALSIAADRNFSWHRSQVSLTPGEGFIASSHGGPPHIP